MANVQKMTTHTKKGQIDALPSSDGGATIEEKSLLWKGYSNAVSIS